MDNNILQSIRTHKVSAANAREFGELDQALQEAMAAIQSGESYLNELRVAPKREPEKMQRTARELADSYGVAGGILRRMKDYGQALAMYEKGAELERDPELSVENTYNQTNALVTKVMASPWTFGQNTTEVEVIRRRVEQQVQETRRQDWWAWADLGTLALLEKDYRMALIAFAKFRSQGATPSNCEKAATVVREITEAVAGFAPDITQPSAEVLSILKVDATPSASRY